MYKNFYQYSHNLIYFLLVCIIIDFFIITQMKGQPIFDSKTERTISEPVITSIDPTSGPGGTLVTITGSGFSENSAENEVMLGDQTLIIKSSTQNILEVIIPQVASTGEIIVIVNGLSSRPPHPVFTVWPIKIITLPNTPQLENLFLHSVDFNNDGKDDVLSIKKDGGMPNRISMNVSVGRQTQGARFGDRTTGMLIWEGRDDDCDGYAVADFDNDGHPDVAMIITIEGVKDTIDLPSVNLYSQDTNRPGHFIFKRKHDTVSQIIRNIRRVSQGDVNGDALPDIICITEGFDGDSIVVLLNDSLNPGSFSRSMSVGTGKNVKAAIYDRWGELIWELYCVTENSLDRYRWERGAQGGILQLHSTIPIRETAFDRSLAVGDLDGDGWNEVVILDDDSSYVSIIRKGAIELSKGLFKGRMGKPRDLFLMDINLDGKLDIVYNEIVLSDTTNSKSSMSINAENVYLNLKGEKNITALPDSDLIFEEITILIPDSSSLENRVLPGDYDGDGYSDLILIGVSSSTLNPPIIRNLSSNRRVAGLPLRVEGINLSTTNNIEVCNPCTGPVLFSNISDTELDMIMPGEFGDKYFTISNDDGEASHAFPVTILEVPDMFVSVPPESLVLTALAGKFVKPVKRGKGLHPNWINLLEEVVVQGGFQPGASESDAAGGLRVGISHIYEASIGKWKPIKDSALVRAWVAIRGWDWKKNSGKNWSGIQKTLKNKSFEHDGIARGLDSTGSPGDPKRKKLKGELKILDPKKTSNKLFAELVALKFNIAASQLGKTPVGFGELIYDNDSSMFDEMPIIDISRKADSAMTYYTGSLFEDNGHDGINSLYESLYRVIYQINRAFVGPLDTASFEVGRSLILNGVVDLSTVPFLRMPSSFKPRILYPTTTLTESMEDMESIEGAEKLPTIAKLYQNYPNPFNPTTTISFGLKNNSIVTLKVYNMLGQEVLTLFKDQELEGGNHLVEFDADNLSSGVYLYRIVVEEIPDIESVFPKRFVEQRKMLLLK